MLDLEYTPDAKSRLHVALPDNTFAYDGTLCTVPTPIKQSFAYIIDNLELGDNHYHYANINTEIRPNYIAESFLNYSQDYLEGKVQCPPFYIRFKDRDDEKPQKPDKPLEGELIPGIFVKPKDRNVVYVKPEKDDIFFKVYPAIWQDDELIPPETNIGEYIELKAIYQVKEYTYKSGKVGKRDAFYALNQEHKFSGQVWPAQWQYLGGEPVKGDIQAGNNVKLSKVYMHKETNIWYIETNDKKERRRIYPAYFEPTRNHDLPLEYTTKYPDKKPFQEESYTKAAEPRKGNYRIGKYGYVLVGDPKYKAYRRSARVLLDDKPYTTVYSKIMQLRDGHTQDFSEELWNYNG